MCVKPEVDGANVVTFSGSERLTAASSHNSLPRRDPPSFSAYQQSIRGIGHFAAMRAVTVLYSYRICRVLS